MNDFYSLQPPRKVHPGFTVGLGFGLAIALVHMLLLLIGIRSGWVDFFMLLIIQPVLYYFGGYSAGDTMYRWNINNQVIELTTGIKGAAVGAAFVSCIVVWIYLLVRAVVIDLSGAQIYVEPVSLFFMIVIDALLALGLGALAGRQVENKYAGFQGW